MWLVSCLDKTCKQVHSHSHCMSAMLEAIWELSTSELIIMHADLGLVNNFTVEQISSLQYIFRIKKWYLIYRLWIAVIGVELAVKYSFVYSSNTCYFAWDFQLLVVIYQLTLFTFKKSLKIRHKYYVLRSECSLSENILLWSHMIEMKFNLFLEYRCLARDQNLPTW